MADTAPKANERYTYADYLEWNGPERYELIEGEAYMMMGPAYTHQLVSGEVLRQLLNFLEGKKCKALAAPFDVRLFEKEGDAPEDVDTIVQPDILVTCDTSKLNERGLKGSPDMVIEILSPSTQRHDRLTKLDLYQQARVQEYWIVDPANQSVQVYLLDGTGTLRPHEVYGPKDIAKVNVLEGCFIEIGKVFPE